MEFIAGAVVGFVIAAVLGRAQFLRVQNAARELADQLLREQSISDGLQQELAATAKVV